MKKRNPDTDTKMGRRLHDNEDKNMRPAEDYPPVGSNPLWWVFLTAFRSSQLPLSKLRQPMSKSVKIHRWIWCTKKVMFSQTWLLSRAIIQHYDTWKNFGEQWFLVRKHPSSKIAWNDCKKVPKFTDFLVYNQECEDSQNFWVTFSKIEERFSALGKWAKSIHDAI